MANIIRYCIIVCCDTPLLFLFPKAAQTEVKVRFGVAMETVSDDGQSTRITPVPTTEKWTHMHSSESYITSR